jgi:plastocyanin
MRDRYTSVGTVSSGLAVVILVIVFAAVAVYISAPRLRTGQVDIAIPQGSANGLNFSPSSVEVPSGTTIVWTDLDGNTVHDVHFTSVPPGAADPPTSPNLTDGSTYKVTLTTPGTYKYECEYHSSWMQGSIQVS